MSYLLRIQLPDEPGSLGYVAAALGEVEGDIRSVDVVDYGANGVVVDDIVVDLLLVPMLAGIAHLTSC